VEEVGGGGWVPWSALIGSTWSDEKFNHPPIPIRPNYSTFSSSISTSCASPLSLSLSLSISRLSSVLSRRLDSQQMNPPRIYKHAVCTFLHGSGRGDKVKSAGHDHRLRKHSALSTPTTPILINASNAVKISIKFRKSPHHVPRDTPTRQTTAIPPASPPPRPSLPPSLLDPVRGRACARGISMN